MEPSLYTQNLYVPLYLFIINVHPVKGLYTVPSRRPLNKPLNVSNNFPGSLNERCLDTVAGGLSGRNRFTRTPPRIVLRHLVLPCPRLGSTLPTAWFYPAHGLVLPCPRLGSTLPTAWFYSCPRLGSMTLPGSRGPVGNC